MLQLNSFVTTGQAIPSIMFQGFLAPIYHCKFYMIEFKGLTGLSPG